MMLIGDWTKHGTKAELESEIGYGFVLKEGWTETKTDTIFCQCILPADMNCFEPEYRVTCWNEIGVRAQLAMYLGAAVHS